MTDAYSTPTPPRHAADDGKGAGGATDTARDVADTAKEQASQLGDSAAESAQNVAGTVKAEASNVAGEAKHQAKALYAETTAQLREQAGVQQTRAAEGLHGIGSDLDRMAQSSEQQGIAAELISQISTRVSGVASWLESREPAEVLDEVKAYARRKPGTFIAICAVAGLVAGRLVRSLAADAKDENDTAPTPSQAVGSPVPASTATTVPATSGYEAAAAAAGDDALSASQPAHAAPTFVDAPPVPGQASPYDEGQRP